MFKVIIWHDGSPISTGIHDDISTLARFAYTKTKDITDDEITAFCAYWSVKKCECEKPILFHDHDLKITIRESDGV